MTRTVTALYLIPDARPMWYMTARYLASSEVHPDASEAYGFKEVVSGMWQCLTCPCSLSLQAFDRIYENIIKYPANIRDISMLVPKELPVGKLEDVIEEREAISSMSIISLTSMRASRLQRAISQWPNLSFRAKDRTLTNEEVDAVMEKIIAGLRELGAELRS